MQVPNCWVGEAKQETFSLSPRRVPTFKVSLWALSPSRILCPPPMRSSMPWWTFWREELNCSDSSIGMVVSESCERNAGTWLTLLAGQLLGSHCVWLFCLLTKAKPEEQPEGMMQESEEPNRAEKAKQRSGEASVHWGEEESSSDLPIFKWVPLHKSC